MKALFFALMFCAAQQLFAQQISGSVFEKNQSEKEIPLPGANVYWINTIIATVTNAEGHFVLNGKDIQDPRIVISFTGYRSDTLLVKEGKEVRVLLQNAVSLKEVQVVQDISHAADPLKMEQLSSLDLKKSGML
jgi:hypothetical protein